MDNKLPQGFIEEMRSILDETESEAFLRAMDEEPSVSVRLNRRKPVAGALYPGMEPVAWCPSAFYLPERPTFTMNPLLHGGAFYVQDASSTIYETLVSEILKRDAMSHPLVLDMCAAPGGKTTAMINALPDTAIVVANEFVEKRARILEENLCKWGFPDCIVTNSDSSRIADTGVLFDIVAVDAPCSGEGMMRKDEEARRQWSPALVEQCASLQREILDNAVDCVRPGGYLIYSTCTFNKTENEENAEYLVKEKGLQSVEIRPEGLPEESYRLSQAIGKIPALRFMPHFTKGEGLFAAVFRKPGDEEPGKSPVRVAMRNRKNVSKRSDCELIGDYICKEKGGVVRLMSPEVAMLADRLSGVRILTAGVRAGEMKGKDIVPDVAVALSVALDPGRFPDVALSREDALRYLRKETISLPGVVPKGFATVSCEGVRLGMVKHLGNRTNNLYPAYWRIRTQG